MARKMPDVGSKRQQQIFFGATYKYKYTAVLRVLAENRGEDARPEKSPERFGTACVSRGVDWKQFVLQLKTAMSAVGY